MKTKLWPVLPLILMAQLHAQKINLLVGTYTHSCDSKGIYVYDYDSVSGSAVLKNQTEKVSNPSYLTVDGNFVYSVNEDGVNGGVSAFAFDPVAGSLSLLNSQPTQGADPCYILQDKTNLIVANYSGGSITVFRKNSDGSLSEPVQVIQQRGRGPNPQRQEKSHLHQVLFTPDRKYILATDLGSDQLYLYRYYPVAAKGVLMLQEAIAVKPGSGPRHLTFSPDGHFAYLLQELDGTITTFSYRDGIFKRLKEDTVLAAGFKGQTAAADLHITPDGKFLYATNRGTANDITTFAIDKTGLLKFVNRSSSGGKGPRNFAIDPSGNFLLLANENTHNIEVFSINKTTGALKNTGKPIKVCAPVCLVFAP